MIRRTISDVKDGSCEPVYRMDTRRLITAGLLVSGGRCVLYAIGPGSVKEYLLHVQHFISSKLRYAVTNDPPILPTNATLDLLAGVRDAIKLCRSSPKAISCLSL